MLGKIVMVTLVALACVAISLKFGADMVLGHLTREGFEEGKRGTVLVFCGGLGVGVMLYWIISKWPSNDPPTMEGIVAQLDDLMQSQDQTVDSSALQELRDMAQELVKQKPSASSA